MTTDLDQLNLGESFRRLFRLAPALDEESRLETYRVRHDVYCRDLHWEPERPDGLETDEYDRHSVNCLMRTADERNLRVGSLRLVMARPEDPDYPMPMERSCAHTIDRSVFDPASIDRHTLAEVSRLAVVNEFRRRQDEAAEPAAVHERDFGSTEQPRFPFIPVGLYLSAFAVAEHLGIEHLMVLTEPRLARHFAKIGFRIQQIGGAIEHRGLRIPSVMHTTTVIENLSPRMRPMWETVRRSVEATFNVANSKELPWKAQTLH